MKKILFFVGSLSCFITNIAVIRIVSTAALVQQQFEQRKQEYIICAQKIKDLGYTTYAIEACYKHGPTFLDTAYDYVFYSGLDNPTIRNKGINEARTLLHGLQHFAFDPQDIIVKITGRYHFTSGYLLNILEENPAIDAAVLIVDNGRQVFTGCFAMKNKYLIDMLSNLDLNVMEQRMINIEIEVARYIRKMQREGALVLVLDHVGVAGKIFGAGTQPLALSEKFYW